MMMIRTVTCHSKQVTVQTARCETELCTANAHQPADKPATDAAGEQVEFDVDG